MVKLINFFWSCESEDLTRVKRLADISTQIGGGRINDSSYSIINIHGPTAGWMCGGFVVLLIIAAFLWVMHRRRQKKLKKIVAGHRRARWNAVGYHKNECNKIDHAKQCDCKPNTRDADDAEDPTYRKSFVFDA